MNFDLFIPYQMGLSDSPSNNMDGYYSSESDYVNALRKEEEENASIIFNAMASGELSKQNTYGTFSFNDANTNPQPEASVKYAKATCTLFSPNGANPETVDSVIDKFVLQSEFLVLAQFNMSSMDAEFEEELMEWHSETKNILKHQRDMGNDWVDQNIPRRELRLSFLNKSNKIVNFILEDSEIEEKISSNRYLLYVKKMRILK